MIRLYTTVLYTQILTALKPVLKLVSFYILLVLASLKRFHVLLVFEINNNYIYIVYVFIIL